MGKDHGSRYEIDLFSGLLCAKSIERPHILCMSPWFNQRYGHALHTQLRTVESCLCPFLTPVILVFDLDYLLVVSHLASCPLSLTAWHALLLILCSLCSPIYTIILKLYRSRVSTPSWPTRSKMQLQPFLFPAYLIP